MLKTITVNSYLLDILQKCMNTNILKDFVLVGGTALALQRGHRISIDIDLFTSLGYGEMPTDDIKDFFENNFSENQVDGLNDLKNRALGYHIRTKDKDKELKIDLFYTENFIFPIKQIGNIRLADEREIAAMKMLAIGIGANRIKDYWDIHELLEDYSITDMIRWGYERNQYTLTIEDIVKGLNDVIKLEPVQGLIQNIKDNSWSFVQTDICNALNAERQNIQNIMSFIDNKEEIITLLYKWSKSKRTLPTQEITEKFGALINNYASYQDSFNVNERINQFINDEILFKLKHELNEEEIRKIDKMLRHETDFLEIKKGRNI